MANYQFVVNSTFRPFSMQEMLTPLLMYKEAYDKTEEAYNNLYSKADVFKELSDRLEDGSRAKALYENYANELKKQADDLSKNGLTIGNRMALTSLKRRYSGEIGTLERAKEQLDELQKGRNALAAAGKPMLYASENPTIDDMLDGSSFNRYSIDSNELYSRGANIGKSISSRMYTAGDNGSTLGGYYRNWVERYGVNQDSIAAFMNSDAVQQAADNALAEKGVYENLTGSNLQRARQSILDGIYEGIVYQEKQNPTRDLGVLTENERRAEARANRNQLVSEAMNGISWIDGRPVYNPNNDISLQKQLTIAEAKGGTKSSGNSSKGGNTHFTQSNDRIKISWNSNDPSTSKDNENDYTISSVDKDETAHPGALVEYDELPDYAKRKVDTIIGDADNSDYYQYYFKPFSSGFWNDTEAELEIVPRKIVTDDKKDSTGVIDFGQS